MNTQEQTSPGSSIVRDEFGATQIQMQNETAAIAVAAAEKAAIESRYILAKKFPRDWNTVRERLEKECKRPGFAESAIYRKPVGKRPNPKNGEWEMQYIEGLSIRFAEAAIRHVQNFYASAKSIYDDADKSITRVTVMDLETNATIETDVQVSKTVERKKLKDGQQALGRRVNSNGEVVHIVHATDDDVLNKTNALISKALRNGVMRLLPGDIQDECEAICRETQQNRDAKDPDAAKKALFRSFAGVGISAEQLREYIGTNAETLQPAQLSELRAIFSAIRDGEATWSTFMDAKEAKGDGAPDSKAEAQQKHVADLLTKQREKAAAAAAAKSGNGAVAATPPASEVKPAADAGKKAEPEKKQEPKPAQPSARVAVFVSSYQEAATTDDVSAIRRDLQDVLASLSEQDRKLVDEAEQAAIARLKR